MRELAERVLTLTGSSSAIRSVAYGDAYPPGFEEIPRRVPDTARIRAAIGWAPAHDLDSIIKRTIAYATEAGPENLLA
jgi:UDP-glucose 4-epimerase